jgi:L-ascorbate 6-phosphate lactonase
MAFNFWNILAGVVSLACACLIGCANYQKGAEKPMYLSNSAQISGSGRSTMTLAEKIVQTHVKESEVGLFYLAQAGFAIKTSQGTLVCVDPYLSDCCNTMFGFKRMVPSPIEARELDLDVLACTHSHADHLDPETMPVFAKNSKTHFVGARDCKEGFEKAGIAESRYSLLAKGERKTIRDVEFQAVYADHGELAPDAVGYLIRIDGITIYQTGDTGYQPEKIMESLGKEKIDVMIAPINGAYGNLNEVEACKLASVVKPRMVIGCHYGMFKEHGGDPKKFIEESKKLPKGVEAIVMDVGEVRMIRENR